MFTISGSHLYVYLPLLHVGILITIHSAWKPYFVILYFYSLNLCTTMPLHVLWRLIFYFVFFQFELEETKISCAVFGPFSVRYLFFRAALKCIIPLAYFWLLQMCDLKTMLHISDHVMMFEEKCLCCFRLETVLAMWLVHNLSISTAARLNASSPSTHINEMSYPRIILPVHFFSCPFSIHYPCPIP